jgi:hypothetical protein
MKSTSVSEGARSTIWGRVSMHPFFRCAAGDYQERLKRAVNANSNVLGGCLCARVSYRTAGANISVNRCVRSFVRSRKSAATCDSTSRRRSGRCDKNMRAFPQPQDDEIYRNGATAAKIGQSVMSCPYPTGANRRDWLAGYFSVKFPKDGNDPEEGE